MRTRTSLHLVSCSFGQLLNNALQCRSLSNPIKPLSTPVQYATNLAQYFNNSFPFMRPDDLRIESRECRIDIALLRLGGFLHAPSQPDSPELDVI